MVSSETGKQSQLKEFKEFASALRITHLPGTDDTALLRKVFALAKQRRQMQEQSRLATELSKGKFRHRIRVCRMALRTARKADDQIVQAQEICASGFGVPLYEWNHWFEPVRNSIKTLMSNLAKIEDEAIAQVHPRYRQEREKPRFEALFRDYDYDLSRMGWKPSQKWFLAELMQVLSAHFKKKRTALPLTQVVLRSLIIEIMVAAFNETLSDDAIKSAMYRTSKERNLPISKRSKRISKSKTI